MLSIHVKKTKTFFIVNYPHLIKGHPKSPPRELEQGGHRPMKREGGGSYVVEKIPYFDFVFFLTLPYSIFFTWLHIVIIMLFLLLKLAAKDCGHGEVARLLLDRGADPNVVTRDGQRAADIAGTGGNWTLQDVLEQFGGGKPVGGVRQMERKVRVTSNQVENVLLGLDLGEYVEMFREAEVGLEEFLLMREDELEKVGVTKVGARKKITIAQAEIHKKDWERSSLPKLQYDCKKKGLTISTVDATGMMANISQHARFTKANIGYIRLQLRDHGDRLLQVSNHRQESWSAEICIVVINGVTSNEATISCGVPQGSVLGPLLLIIFINDAPKGFKDLLTILFADDTTLQMSNQDAHVLFEKVNNALALASDWFKANKLTLHPSKTKYIFFSAGQHTELINETLTLDGVAIEQIELNCETWEGQQAHVYQKAAAGTFMLARLKRTVPHIIRLMIYNSLVRPYFEYCIEVWGCSKASDLKVFFKLQKMCVRHISGAGYRAHTDPLFASNKILKIEDLVKYKLLTLTHQAFYASRPLPPPPPPLSNLFSISELPNRNLLFKFSQQGPIFGIDYPTVRIPKLWSL